MVAAATAVIIFASGTHWTVRSNKKTFQIPSYQVSRVIDGDTFETAEKQYIRLLSVDAPEPDRCGGEEAKKELEKLVENKPVYLKVVFTENGRLIADVYTNDGSVSEALIRSGWGYYTGRDVKELKEANEEARTNKRGIFSIKCTQETNPDNPDCVIKGNQRYGDKEKFYRFPGCRQYNLTTVQLYQGDQWFCSEREARKAGYAKGADCGDKKWQP